MKTSNPQSVGELLSYYSDFYKEIHGFRPILGKPWIDFTHAEAQALIDSCHAYLDALASTPAGREELERAGWVLDDMPENGPAEDHDQFRDDVEADADTLRSAGWGTDEDYGYYGEEY